MRPGRVAGADGLSRQVPHARHRPCGKATNSGHSMALNPISMPRRTSRSRCRNWACGCAASRFLRRTHSARFARHPQGPTTPEIWILGSSDYVAQLAAHFRLPYAYAYYATSQTGYHHAVPDLTVLVTLTAIKTFREAICGHAEAWGKAKAVR